MHLSDIHMLFEYNTWANNRIFSVLETLSHEQFTRDFGSSHGGLRGTCHHTMGAEEIWLRRWQGHSPTSFSAIDQFPTYEAISNHWEMIDHEIMGFCHMLRTDEDITRVVSYTDLRGNPFHQPLFHLMQHLVNHSSYHRGQINGMIRQLGVKPKDTDLVIFLREKAQ